MCTGVRLQGPGAVHPANVLQTPLPNAKGFRVYCMYGVGTPTERGYHYLKTRKQGPGGTVHIEWSINNVADDPKSGLVRNRESAQPLDIVPLTGPHVHDGHDASHMCCRPC